MGRASRRIAACVAAVTCLAVAGLARAAILPIQLGPYAGKVAQVVPHHYMGRIHFAVHRHSITALSFKVGVLCKGLWVIDSDALSQFKTRITRTGSFAYSGTMDGRHIRFRGKVVSGLATGRFFQSFLWGGDGCSMSKSAFFTALR